MAEKLVRMPPPTVTSPAEACANGSAASPRPAAALMMCDLSDMVFLVGYPCERRYETGSIGGTRHLT